MSDDFHITISSPHRGEHFAQLVDTLEEGAEVVWNGRDEPATVTAIEDEQSSPDGLGRFKKRVVLENQTRSNGAKFRLTYEDGTDGVPLTGGEGIDARCHIQRQIGDRAEVNPNGWGRTTDIETLSLVNPVKVMGVEQ